MSTIIKNRQAIADDFTWVTLAEDETALALTLSQGPLLVPLSVWQARKSELLARQAAGTPVGVWLAPNEDPKALANDLSNLPVIGVHFPKFVDGRGYSIARLLRERYGYTGEIRALGDILHDQLFLMTRCGFDAFAFKEGKNIAAALTAFDTFKNPYQAGVDQTQPLFRRRAA